MLVPVSISSEDLIAQYSMSKEETEDVIDAAVKEIAAKFASYWEQQAMLDLHTTRQRYLENLFVIDSGRLSGAVVLDYSKDPLIRMIEEGASAFDMKEGFEKSKSVKYNKSGGWYLTVPFRLGAPDTIGEAVGGVTNLPQEVYNVVKKKTIDTVTGRSAGLGLEEIPEKYRAPQTRARIEIPQSKAWEAYQHKTSLYQGVFKQKDKTTGQNTYGSFRRVGENSDHNSWIHPGLEESNLAEKAMDRLDQNMAIELSRAIDSALQQFGFE